MSRKKGLLLFSAGGSSKYMQTIYGFNKVISNADCKQKTYSE